MISKSSLDEIVRKVDELRQLCYQNFAFRITEIEHYLSSLTERVQNGEVIVTGNFKIEKISPVNISLSELVQVYNDVPNVLFKNSVVVELTAKSYRQLKEDEASFLENDENGKYWVITTDKDEFWLVPSINIKLNIHKLKTVQKLFYFRGDFSSADSHFILINPARVSSSPSGKNWKLEEKGVLEFSDPFLQLPLELEATIEKLPDFQGDREDSELKIQKLSKQLDDLRFQLKQSQEEKIKLESQIDLIKVRLDSLEEWNIR
ncbi:hypothetical protein VB620_10510 [Nodularia harveyana UHCC-0300]|uniref:Uncharacterized protein n=1 Tax=Nodularia harveyana UHCC-0300 TaxID=2974287 RepID=A0ABU5UE30_9CYAN|nr:hypothetical protein [Nodularia harveyana]MEA5581768.1 hypothetical protein [Nodularia harveyana UHCC-0300]